VKLLPLNWAGGMFHIITDVALLAMPLPVVLRLHTRWRRKGNVPAACPVFGAF
jgi:hypothetical protein